MKTQIVPISKVKPNADNPRLIKNIKFKKLVASIEELPSMLKLRPIVVDDNYTILGGNMRYKACIEAGLKEIPIIVASDLSEEDKKAFIIKDNVSFGEWDWEVLGNEYTFEELDTWAMDLPSDMFREDVDYSLLDDEDFEEELDNMEGDVRRGIQVPFEAEDYEEAKELYKYFVDEGHYVGGMIIEFLKEKRKNLAL